MLLLPLACRLRVLETTALPHSPPAFIAIGGAILAPFLQTGALVSVLPSLACQPLNRDSVAESAAALPLGPVVAGMPYLEESRAAAISPSVVPLLYLSSDLTLAVVAVKNMPGP